ncbi:MAG: transposase [Methanomicrobiaceae archaeon]|nr:transposase [Methanomicrobiaceae archaeon]
MTETQTAQSGRWIGIDLNTTGYVAVVADPETGFTAKLGREARLIHEGFSRERKKLKNKKRNRNLKRLNQKENSQLKDLNKYLSKEIVRIASDLGCGIKFERLSGKRLRMKSKGRIISEFSINNWYFSHLCQMVENRAIRQGISVLYVDPSFTSQICNRCGALGHRHRKIFQCRECSYIGHADVNAAFNIARSPVNRFEDNEKAGYEENKAKIRKEIRRINAHKKVLRPCTTEWSGFPAESFSLLFENSCCEV